MLHICDGRLSLHVIDAILNEPVKHLDHCKYTHEQNQASIEVLTKHCQGQTNFDDPVMQALIDSFNFTLSQATQEHLHSGKDNLYQYV